MEYVRIGFEPADLALQAGRLMMDSRHRKWDCEWVRHIRRRLRDGDGVLRKTELGVYRHAETGKWVLYEALDNGYPMANEIRVMDLPPDRGGAPAPEILKLMLVGPHEAKRRVERTIMEARGRRESRRQDNLTQRNEAEKWLRKKGMDDAASLLRVGGYLGEAEGETYRETVEKMKETARGRIITSG